MSRLTPPSSPTASALSGGGVRFQWTRGTGNVAFCIDTAFTADDLTGFKGSWANWGCGTFA